MDLTDTELRLVRAWRESGLSLGKLLVAAANQYALGAAVSLSYVTDADLADMASRYVREGESPYPRGAKPKTRGEDG